LGDGCPTANFDEEAAAGKASSSGRHSLSGL